MGCGCNSPINSWIDWRNTDPKDPLDLIANVVFDNVAGIYQRSTTYNPSGVAWLATPGISVNSSPICQTLATDSSQMVADAAQWTFAHQTPAAGYPFANASQVLNKVLFLRGGTQWKMLISLAVPAMTDIELSFRDNAGTRGDAQGTIPTFYWASVPVGPVRVLEVTLRNVAPARAVMGLKATVSGQNTMYESEWNIVP